MSYGHHPVRNQAAITAGAGLAAGAAIGQSLLMADKCRTSHRRLDRRAGNKFEQQRDDRTQ